MTNGPCQTVENRLLVFVNVAVAVGNAVGVEIGVVVVMIVIVMMVRHLLPSFFVFPDYNLFYRRTQAPTGDRRAYWKWD